MKYIQIVATDRNNVIGKNNRIPWSWTKDLQWFKKMTEGKAVVMGYNTWESINFKKLPNRDNFVLTSKHPENIIYKSSIKELHPYLINYDEVFIIGGQKVYESYMPYCDFIYKCILPLTIVNGDRFYPQIPENYKLINKQVESDERIIEFYENIAKSSL